MAEMPGAIRESDRSMSLPERVVSDAEWGVTPRSPQWITWLRILFVVDRTMTLGFGPEPEFGLGHVLDTLRDRKFAWWVRFLVDVGWRGPSIRWGEADDLDPTPSLPWPLPGWTPSRRPPLALKQYVNFRFTHSDFRLDDYDQVWFFGAEGGGMFEMETPLDDGELTESVIREFPDHMHEGEVFGEADIALDNPLDIPGYTGSEYPPAIPLVQARIFGGGGPSPFARPVPKVVAHGYTTHEIRKRFALIGAYDGDSARIGRIVVDSTWHHWLSMNLYGFRHTRPRVYRLMQAYFRNVALWLARRHQRAEMLYAAMWGALTGTTPMKLHSG